MRFLTGADIRAEISRLVGRGGELRAAVAYWGNDGANHTGIAARSDPESIRVICDLASDACNPSEIRAMTDRHVPIRHLPRLHAKVWICGDTAIVGSANASTGGLGNEKDRDANIEAAVMTHDAALAHEIREWFDRLWRRQAVPIDDTMLAAAEEASARRQRSAGNVDQEQESVAADGVDLLWERLIDQVVDTAVRIDRSGHFRPNIVDLTLGICDQDPLWKRDYETYLGSGPAQRHKQKERINTQFTKKVAAAIGAETRPPSQPALTAILTEYTPLSKP